MSRILIAALIFAINTCRASPNQASTPAVDYRISVALDDTRHVLRGHIRIHYANRSSDTLLELHLHVYPNAYSSGTTAFAQQALRQGDIDFHFAEAWERGGIDSLDFTVGNRSLAWRLDDEDPDIAYLTLPEPLQPGDSIAIVTPFRVKIPRSFSRLGRIGQSYQVTQWFPKVARYDEQGWQSMPYLDQGEFYSDFANYEVTITLPANYRVAATGILEDARERAWLDSLSAANASALISFPASSVKDKTLRFTANNVVDFAWFADKRFAVRQRTIRIDGRQVICRAFFTATDQDLWSESATYIADALQFYSRHVGLYPYPQMTAVQAPLSAGGGMEYPMITLIGKEHSAYTLDQVIAHEVGHNWFYGIIASNERQYPWMDEGLNSYYEYRYLEEKYGRAGNQFLPRFDDQDVRLSDAQMYLHYLHRQNRLQPAGLSAGDQTTENYILNAYEKPALAWGMLAAYLGREGFDRAMQAYFRQWQFGHPRPDDLRDVLESECLCDLAWLFEGLLGTAHLPDYRISSLHGDTLHLENRGTLIPPVQVLGIRDDSIVFVRWIDGFSRHAKIAVGGYIVDRWQLYEDAFTLDATPADNQISTSGGRAVRTRLSWIGGVTDVGVRHFNIAPVLPAWNQTDKAMLGLAISNLHWPPKNLLWIAAPFYATGSKSLTGLAEIRYQLPRRVWERQWEMGLAAKSFHYNRDTDYDFRDRYFKLAWHTQLTLRSPDLFDTGKRSIRYRGVWVRQSYGKGIDFEQRVWQRQRRDYWVNALQYLSEDQDPLAPRTLKVEMMQGRGFVRLSADVRQSLIYDRRGKGIHLHGFAGWLPHRDAPPANVNFYFNGIPSNGFFSKDYLYDELLLARNADSGIWAHQVFNKDAQLKTLYSGGLSDSWMLAAGIAADVPMPIPIQPYLDVAIAPDLFEDRTAVNYSGGVAVILLKDVLEIYLPLVESREIRKSLTYQTRKSVVQRMSFVINLKALHPFDLFARYE